MRSKPLENSAFIFANRRIAVPKLFIATVGTGLNNRDVATAILKSIQHQNPDFVALIASGETAQGTAQLIVKGLEEQNRKHEVHVLQDENDLETVIEDIRGIIQKYFNAGCKAEDTVVDYTSGTKAMSAGLVIAAMQCHIGAVVYITGKRGEGGRVVAGTERFNCFEPNKTYAEELFREAVAAVNKYRFDAATELLQKARTMYHHQGFLGKVNLLETMAAFYGAWDRFELEKATEAASTLSRIDRSEEIMKDWRILQKVKRNKESVFQEHRNKFSALRAVDLLANAQRRFSEGKYDDGVARLYRLIEFIAQYYGAERGIYKTLRDGSPDTEHIDLQKLPEQLREHVKESSALVQTLKLLSDLGHADATTLYQDISDSEKGKLKELLHVRNNSILAHGFKPIGKERAGQMLESVRKHVETLCRRERRKLEDLMNDVSFPYMQVD